VRVTQLVAAQRCAVGIIARAWSAMNMKPFSMSLDDRAVFGGLILLNLALRILLLDVRSDDFDVFLSKWYQYIIDHGGFRALRDRFYDYTPAYIYLLWLLTETGLPALAGIKILSTGFDFALALVAGSFVKAIKPRWSRLAIIVVLFSPPVLMNSAVWGQCDAIYAFFLICSFFFLAQKRTILSFAFYATAFSFKLQAILLAPVFLVAAAVWFKPLDLLKLAVAVVTVYVLTVLPAWVAGRRFLELVEIYADQTGGVGGLGLVGTAPGFVLLLMGFDANTIGAVMLNELFWLFTLTSLLVSIGLVLLAGSLRPPLSNETVLATALLFAVCVPFFLPGMHERYFYVAEVLSVIISFYGARWIPVAVILNATAAATYTHYMFLDVSFVSLRVLSFFMLVAVLTTFFNWLFTIRNPRPPQVQTNERGT
jgi:Gpi18-like mannosyltransferase